MGQGVLGRKDWALSLTLGVRERIKEKAETPSYSK